MYSMEKSYSENSCDQRAWRMLSCGLVSRCAVAELSVLTTTWNLLPHEVMAPGAKSVHYVMHLIPSFGWVEAPGDVSNDSLFVTRALNENSTNGKGRSVSTNQKGFAEVRRGA